THRITALASNLSDIQLKDIVKEVEDYLKTYSSTGMDISCIWKALGGNTRDLDSIWEETGQDYNFTRSDLKNVRTVLGDGVAIPSDDVRNLATRAIETPLSSPVGTMWCLCDPTPSGWRKTDALSTDFGPRIQINILRIFLKLVDSLDLDVANKEKTHLFQFSLHDQASNWLERLPAGSISTWEDLTTCFLAQFFPLGRTAKLRNDILMF
ncbi:zinc finger, CCHC-type containing protein, partial [Tanacetum coccineum]